MLHMGLHTILVFLKKPQNRPAAPYLALDSSLTARNTEAYLLPRWSVVNALLSSVSQPNFRRITRNVPNPMPAMTHKNRMNPASMMTLITMVLTCLALTGSAAFNVTLDSYL